ncbi:MAG TPA: BON domain-containing protein [Gemmataceae bacterium]|nr:BON domain-containing protein [Gemmataceae bacterium]
MKTTRYAWLLLLTMSAVGCNQQDTDALKRISGNVQARAEVVTGDAKNNALMSWNTVADSGAASHVAARIRWDKELAGNTIEVLALGAGVELRGKVRNLGQRQRAIMLAETTAGVEGVKDSLIESDR